jgi:5'-nucleotidase
MMTGCVAALAFSACIAQPTQITILATNDIHGDIEPTRLGDGSMEGGLAAFSGTVRAVKTGLMRRFGHQAGVLVLDAGDQFQGTLISNHNEGKLLFQAMSQVGYDAVITGNHDYDFGPVGWLVDTATENQDPRAALKAALAYAQFPLISANTFLRASLRDAAGNQVEVKPQGCEPIVAAGQPTPQIDWDKAATLDFLKPYVIKDIAGVRVAIIGVDNMTTPVTTTPANVKDLCFEREAEAYLRVRAQLDGKADVFVLLIHDGNANTHDLTAMVHTMLLSPHPARGAVVDAVVSGHTHFIDEVTVGGVPIIQSGANGKAYGRIDLTFDPRLGGVDPAKTKLYAGVETFQTKCALKAKDYCTVDSATNALIYEGEPFQNDEAIVQLIAMERQAIAPLAGQVLGTATSKVETNYTEESALADALTDIFRKISSADVALINTGGIRAALETGEVTYEKLFRVFPFNNHGVVIGPMRASVLLSALTRSAQACGDYGALMESGLKVVLQKDCNPPSGKVGTDPNAKLLRVETLAGQVLLDTATGIPAVGSEDPLLSIATLDFLAAGGSGYVMLSDVPVITDIGILRETMKDAMVTAPVTFTPSMDGRWAAQKPPTQ